MNLAEKLTTWAENEPSVSALVLIGSRIRSVEDAVFRSDANSDWDFQIICSQPRLFANRDWATSLDLDLYTYCVRRAAIGGVPKIAAMFAAVDADFVIISAKQLLLARWMVRLGLHRHSARLRRALQDIAIVIRPGWRFLKGENEWGSFYRQVVQDVTDPRLTDEEIRSLADNFVCDANWTSKKIQRGESLAAQRMLHRSLAETNFSLLHELKLRLGQRSFPEARRSEFVLSEKELAAVTLKTAADPVALRAALEKSSETCRSLLHALVGESWRWPVSGLGCKLHKSSTATVVANVTSSPEDVFTRPSR